jgi:glycosyltransferase involved in cell wall biosynthesis
LRIIICWTEIAGYTAACWRDLAARPGIELSILAWPSASSSAAPQFQRTLVQGLDVRFLEPHEQQNAQLIAQLITEKNPEALIMGGWAEKPYRDLVWNPSLKNCRIILAMDSPWTGSIRQRLARLKIGRYIDRLDAIFVPGQRGQTFGTRLRMPHDRIFTGMYACDYNHFAPALAQRLAAGPWPKSFLYMGRYTARKGLATLAAGYLRYRHTIPDPWPLVCYGAGADRYLFRNLPGITINNWAQPAEQPQILARHGVYVLTSRYEPWAVAVAEAMAAGLPVICTDAVGAAPDLITPNKNGLIIPTQNPRALASAFQWMHEHHADLPAMGQAAQPAALPYSAQAWADRVQQMTTTLAQMPARR